MQETPDGPWPAMEEMITTMTRQYKNGITEEIQYHSQMALLYSNLKNVEECRMHAALVPDTANDFDKENVYMSLARMLIYEKKLGEAIVYYEKCLEISPGNETALDEIAWCCYHEKRFTEAEKWFRQAVASDDLDIETIWEGFGLTLSALKKYEEAIPCFSRALELQEDDLNINFYEFMIGLCYANEKDFYRALSHYTKSLDADPGYAHSLTNIATLYYDHESDIQTAITYLKKAEEICEAKEDMRTLQTIYINLVRLYKQLAEYDLQESYNIKLLTILGFGIEDGEDDEDYENGEDIE